MSVKDDAVPGLFFTSLVTLQTKPDLQETAERAWHPRTEADKDWDRSAAREAYRLPPANSVELAFRHRGWWSRRTRVGRALSCSGVGRATLERFEQCGSDCVIEVQDGGHRHRVRANHCGNRFCEPCSGARGRKVRERLEEWTRGQACTFGTLTIRECTGGLIPTLQHLRQSFVRLRETKLWKNAVRAGAYVIEITLGAKLDHWHVHLHFLALSKYIRQDALSDAWRKCSRGSFVVHLRRVKARSRDISYVAKYATKGFSNEVANDHDRLVECMVALRGTRMLGTFGAWRNNDLEREQDDDVKWNRVGRLVEVYNAAIRGERWAIGCFQCLGVTAVESAGAVGFDKIKGDPAKPTGP